MEKKRIDVVEVSSVLRKEGIKSYSQSLNVFEEDDDTIVVCEFKHPSYFGKKELNQIYSFTRNNIISFKAMCMREDAGKIKAEMEQKIKDLVEEHYSWINKK